ncbi:MAG: Lrp/AsnC ligand binding domain-containing protein, partial [Deltaproteobacteria bacterium]|nr:Lrp/AsnC ligand binding domain-containing protein [Deltaproteobacteria bacterium]
PHIRACYNITRLFDYILHVCVHDLDQLGNLIKSEIMSLPGVVKSETFIIFTEIKPDTGLPLADELINGE